MKTIILLILLLSVVGIAFFIWHIIKQLDEEIDFDLDDNDNII